MSEELPVVAEVRFRTRYVETDQMGVIHHANYFAWMEMARTELCRARGVRYRDIEVNDNLLLVVAEVHCRYHRPAHYDDEVLARVTLKHAHPRMLTFAYEILNAEDGGLLASGETRHLFTTREGKPAKVPPKYYAVFGIQ